MGNNNNTFGSSSTAEEVSTKANLTGKIIIVTGSNTGIGRETARVLLWRGATVIMACRDREKADKVRQEIIKEVESYENKQTEEKKEEKKDDTSGGDVSSRIEVMSLDLGSLKSVREFASEFVKKYDRLHFLVNNAGIMAVPDYKTTTDNFELQFGTNHLGHYYLIRLLIPTMLNTPGMSRLVQLSSDAHKYAPNPFVNVIDGFVKRQDGPQKSDYNDWRNYGISKACNVLCARHVNTLYGKTENGISGVSLHPGVIPTELTRHLSSTKQWAFRNIGGLFFKNIPQGAATTVRCVCLSEEELNGGGQYYKDCNARNDQLREDMRLKGDSSDNIDTKLWEVSEKMIVAKGFSMSLADGNEQKPQEEEQKQQEEPKNQEQQQESQKTEETKDDK